MELDDLRREWQARNDSTHESIPLDAQFARAVAANAAGTAIDRLGRSLIREAALGALVVVLLGGYVADRFAHAGFAVAGAVLDVYAIVLLAAAIRQLVLVRSIDLAEPVLAVQTRLAEVRMVRVRTTLAALALGPLMWAPSVVVVADILTGSDATVLAAPYLAANLAFGAMILIAAFWAARRFGPRLERSSVLRVVADSLAGTAMQRATASLATVREFGRG